MDEAEWFAERKQPLALLAHVGRKVSARKRRLFACACCRRIWHLIDDWRCRGTVGVAERFADGLATSEELAGAEAQARAGAQELLGVGGRDDGAWACHALCAAKAGMTSTGNGAVNAAGIAVRAVQWGAFSEALRQGQARFDIIANQDRFGDEERAEQCRLMRAILGNPFHPLPPRKGKRAWEQQKRSWLERNDGLARTLAEGIYDEQRFEDLPILADALEDAGCTETTILEHFRGPGPHVRGCWALDLVLAKE